MCSIGVRYKLAVAAAQIKQSVSNLFATAISDDQPLQIEMEPVLEDAMDMDTARVALQRMKRKNLVRTMGSKILSHDEHVIALDIKGRGSLIFSSDPNARKKELEGSLRFGGDRTPAAAALQLWAVPTRQWKWMQRSATLRPPTC